MASGEVVAIPKERCWPVGMPAFLLLPATPVYFLQTAKDVRMIWMQDHQIRDIRLDAQHPADLKPSWYGDSVGHYEGDTLVVDTVGITTKAYVDNYQTPHTEALHVVERYHLIDGGNTLEVNIHVEDPGAFTTPWNAIQRYRKVNRGPLSRNGLRGEQRRSFPSRPRADAGSRQAGFLGRPFLQGLVMARACPGHPDHMARPCLIYRVAGTSPAMTAQHI